jgi:hypothetical protein
MSATIQDPRPLHELAPGLHLARGGPGRTLNVYMLGTSPSATGARDTCSRCERRSA